MDIQRAKEIVTLPNMVNVTLNGQPIYVKSVNDRAGTAKVYFLKEPNREQEVSVGSLMEQ